MSNIIIPIITGIVCLAVGVIIGFLYRKSVAEKEIGSAETEATRIINEAIKAGETKKRESILEAKDEIHKQRVEADRELKERRNETQQLERRLIQREEALDKKSDMLDRKNDDLSRQLDASQKEKEELERIKLEQVEKLEQIASMTRDEARDMLVQSIENEATHDAAVKLREINQRLKDESEQTAREIISTAIQRCAADQVSEATVSVVPLPNDEMKGRIIGREGRNIRTLETLTGVDLIIDDTPEAITLSSFDPVRREIARLALHQLVQDGRIHPARIEEVVTKVKKQVEDEVVETGKRTVIDLGVHGLHPELIRMIGKMKYRSSYGQNLLQHARETANLCAVMASELGLNPKKAKRAGLLHDIGKVPDEEPELPHAILGMKLCEKYKEKPDICNAVGAHHDEVEMQTLLAPIVQVCDAISGARPGARREIVEAYIKRLNDLEQLALSYPGVVKTYAIQAGRELRVIVGADKIDDKDTENLSAEIAKKIQDEMTYPGQVKITVIRETRAVSYAK